MAWRAGWILGTVMVFLALSIGGVAAGEKKYASIVVDAGTGMVLKDRYADDRRYPASLTKMMTLYMLFDALKEGRMHMDTRLRVSRHANRQPPSKLGLGVGQRIKVRDAILALVTKSANDVAVVVAEGLGGSEKNFARQMTRMARRLGMTRTTFRNASGLPDRRQVTTARDMARLAIALMSDHAQYYHFFSTESFTYKGRTYSNHNNLLGRYKGMDGLKTGYINDSGYNLAASASRGGRRLVAVVFGGRSAYTRDAHMEELLDKGFRRAPRGRGRDQTLVLNRMPDMRALTASLPNPTSPDPVPASLPVPKPTPYQRYLHNAALSNIPPRAERRSIAYRAAEPAPRGSRGSSGYQSADQPSLPRAQPVAPRGGQPRGGQQAQRPHPAAPRPSQRTALLGSPQPARAAIPQRQGGMGSRADWGIQVGAFSRYAPAHLAVTQAARRVPHLLMRSRVAIMPVAKDNSTLYRARLVGLDKKAAQEACRLLEKKDMACYPIGPQNLL